MFSKNEGRKSQSWSFSPYLPSLSLLLFLPSPFPTFVSLLFCFSHKQTYAPTDTHNPTHQVLLNKNYVQGILQRNSDNLFLGYRQEHNSDLNVDSALKKFKVY